MQHSRSSVFQLCARGVLAALCVVSGSAVTGVAAHAQTAVAPQVLPYTMSTFAGPHTQYTVGAACGSFTALDIYGDGCVASQVSVGTDPHDIRVDGQGNVYWVDDTNPVIIHRIDAQTQRETAYVGSQVNTKVCTGAADKYGDNCQANDGAANAQTAPNLFTASLAKGRGIAVGANGDLFFADYTGNYVHKVTAATGVFSALTGTGTAGYSDSTQNKSTVSSPRGVGVDAAGNVYFADTGNNVIRVWQAASGNTATITAPSGTEPGNGSSTCNKVLTSGAPALQTQLCAPEDVQVDSRGNIIVADFGNNIVRAIYSGNGGPFFGIPSPQAGSMYTVAGSGVVLAAGTIPPQPANGTSATTVSVSVRKLSVDNAGNLYLADAGFNVIWFVDVRTGGIRLLAGSYGNAAGSPPAGCAASVANGSTVGDGCPGTLASLYNSSDLANAVDNQGNLYITDAEGASSANSRLRKLLSGQNFPATTTGSPLTQTIDLHLGAGDSLAAANALTIATGTAGTVDFVAGTPSCAAPAVDLTVDCTVPVTFTPTRPGYDTATLTVRTTLGGSTALLLTGTGTLSSTAIDPGSVTLLSSAVAAPAGVVVDGAGNTYVADTGNNRVVVTPKGGVQSTFAGTGTAGFAGDGAQATAATLNKPTALAVDTDGNVYIADTGNNRVRRVNAAGVIATVAGGGTGTCATASDTLGDGCAGTAATLAAPAGLAADRVGDLYIADTGNNRIRVLNTFGSVTSFAGGATAVCAAATDVFGDGCAAAATLFNAPAGLAFDATGNNLIVADSGNALVRRIYLGRTIPAASTGTALAVQINPVTLVAGTGAAGSVLDGNGNATLSQLNKPLGVAVGAAGSVYIADSGNDAVRAVSPAGIITTVAGINGAAGAGTVPGSAAGLLLNTPSGVATDQYGNLTVADTANNRVLVDSRSQVSFNFGRINVGSQSGTQSFTEVSNGTVAATLPTPLVTAAGATTQFTFTPASGSTGCASGSFAPGASCMFVAQFDPTVGGQQQATYTETGSGASGGDLAVTLIGTGATLTPTTTTVAQTTPATGNPQFGGPAAVTATVAAACNTAAPSCQPTGNVVFIVDGVALAPTPLRGSSATQTLSGLGVGQHTVGCTYTGDDFYASSSCQTITITVTTATTAAALSTSQNNQPQYTPVTLNATITSAAGVPVGNVTFFANGTSLGTSSVNATTGVASLVLSATYNSNGSLNSNTTLLPGTYALTCSYSGSGNFSASSCPAINFTVAPETADFTLAGRSCGANQLYQQDTTTPSISLMCPGTATNAAPVAVGIAQGSTTDATIFISPANTLAGTATFACAGLPQYTTCTFAPTAIAFTAGTGVPVPAYVDVTLWTDLQPGTVPTPKTSSVHSPFTPGSTRGGGGVAYASLLAWPALLLGMAGIVGFRRRHLAGRALSVLSLLLVLAGGSMVTTGCGGPGFYHPVLTPTGTYPITVSVTVGSVTHSVVVNWTVTPGIPGEE